MPDVNINELICKPGSERAILSILFHNNEKLLECEEQGLFSEMFAVPAHKHLFSALNYLYSNHDVNRIDSLLLYNTINDVQSKQEVDSIGGISYIDTIFDSLPADNLKLYINQVKCSAVKRMAYKLGEDVKDLALNDNSDNLEELLEEIQRRTLDLVLNNEHQEDVYQIGSDAEERLRRRAEHPEEIPGLTMDWGIYDKTTQGYKPNDLTIFVAPSKTGKSTILLNHADKFSVKDGIPGLYIDTEMTDEEQEDRLLAIESGVPYEEIVNGMFSKDTIYGNANAKLAALNSALQKIRESKLFHIYLPNFTIDKVSALVRKYKIQYNIGYFVFDYIKLPTSELAGLANAQEYQRLGFITTCLKDLCGMCGIPGFTAAQSNRNSIGSTSMNETDIGGSYRILQMATRLIFLRNKTQVEFANDGFNAGNQKLRIAFQRNGASCDNDINFQFDRPVLRMRCVS